MARRGARAAKNGEKDYLAVKLDEPSFSQDVRADLTHNIGVTGGRIETRIGNARIDGTYLLADVAIVASYQLANINRAKVESLLHRFFAGAQLDLELPDRFGNLVRPHEWFLVLLSAIDEAVKAIQDRSIGSLRYDREQARLIARN